MLKISLIFLLSISFLFAEEKAGKLKGSYGLGLMTLPKKELSKKQKILPIPMFEMNYMLFYISLMKGIGVNIPIYKNIFGSVGVYYNFNNESLSGGKQQINGGFNYNTALIILLPYNFMLSSHYKQRFDYEDGSEINFSFGYHIKFAEKFKTFLSLSTNYTDKKHNNFYYGEDIKTFKNIAIGSGMIYEIDKEHSINFMLFYSKYIKQIANSEIVKEGVPYKVIGGIIYGWKF
ncbi:MAG: MipA/OmpV family protein [Rickettsiales bacterium]|jgi:outer membrane scaffolding protein for murein synthesis (MipA/OmpV family)|nr:MipA/OmpV family protein [Rickettsiales bacterium]